MAASEDEWPVDELARRAGTTVRNVRLYQERGLLPPPRRDGRRGWYGEDHLARLRLVLSMLRRGYPLTAIRELIEAWEANRSLGDVLGFEEALAQPFTTEQPRSVSPAELAELFPGIDPDSARLALELELVIPAPVGGGLVAPSPALLDAGAQLAADGVPIPAVMEVAADIRAATDKLADRFVSLFVEHVWQPFVKAGMPVEDLPRITEALARQRPLATEALVAALAHAMQRKVDEVIVAEPGLDWQGVRRPTS
ncbi:MAG TPA: MerR family transcriptional regulator [Acidimicrobiales bacterium]|nr:MerR family transcriptional regulator [Acidimicrobiales bacterium]